MPDKTTIGISDLLQQYIMALVEEVVIEGKPIDDLKKKWLQRYSQEEGLDYASLVSSLVLLFEIAEELKTLESKTVEALLATTARECYLSDEETDKLIFYLKEQRATTQRSTGSGEATTYEEVKNQLIETRREKENALAQAEAAKKQRLEAEDKLKKEQESLEKTNRTADEDAAIKAENSLKDLQSRITAWNRSEPGLKNDLEEAKQQMKTAQLSFKKNSGLEDRERKKTKIIIVVTSVFVVALFGALFFFI